ncbi:hypothetical protein ACA910_022572 [Epithemia clementina (nom. ined.)]
MGTTESVFIDEDAPGRGEGSNHHHSGSYPFDAAAAAASPTTVSAASVHSATTIMNNVNGGLKRQRLRTGAIRRPLQLQGALVGMQGSGKRTLLQRLDGQDPFDDVAATESKSNTQIVQPSPSLSQMPTANVVHQVIVPYQPPAAGKVWDRVQLRVQASENIPLSFNSHQHDDNHHTFLDYHEQSSSAAAYREPSSESLDFLVVLVTPKTKPSRLKKYLKTIIHDFLILQGYASTINLKSDANDKNAAINASASRNIVLHRPICLCLLLNFRDTFNPSQNEQPYIQETDVTSMTMDILQHFPDLDPSKILLQFGMTSLKNCYGLDVLHHFIYQSYLLRKQWDLEHILEEVKQVQSQTKRLPARKPYEEFVNRIFDDNHLATTNEHNSNRVRRPISNNQESTTTNSDGLRSDHRDKDEMNYPPSTRVNPAQHSHAKRIRDSPGYRSSVPHPNSSSATTTMPGPTVVSLEAFLASSDDEDDGKDSSRRHISRPSKASDGDDSDDDEFFLTGDNPGSNRKSEDELEQELAKDHGTSGVNESPNILGPKKGQPVITVVNQCTREKEQRASVIPESFNEDLSKESKRPQSDLSPTDGDTSLSSIDGEEKDSSDKPKNNRGEPIQINHDNHGDDRDRYSETKSGFSGVENKQAESFTNTGSTTSSAKTIPPVPSNQKESDSGTQIERDEDGKGGDAVVGPSEPIEKAHEEHVDKDVDQNKNVDNKCFGVNVETGSVVVSLSEQGHKDFIDTDEGDFPDDENAPVRKPTSSMAEFDDDSDDEFFIGDTLATAQSGPAQFGPVNKAISTVNHKSIPAKTAPDIKENKEDGIVPASTNNKAALSFAALAAIAAAQREAELMLKTEPENVDEANEKSEKKKKKKMSKEIKKIKKKTSQGINEGSE